MTTSTKRPHGRAELVRRPHGQLIAKSAPPAVLAAQDRAGMFNRPFGPGSPLAPASGYSVTPRSYDFQTGYNIASRPRRQERMTFELLRALVKSYDVAQMCISHRIDSVRSLSYNLVPLPDVTRNVDELIGLGKRLLKRPDRKRRFKTWLYLYLYDVLAYDAGALYRMRNNVNQVIGLKHVDGTTIAPLIDDYGDEPQGAAPAYMQFIQGIPWSELNSSDLIYEPFRPSTESPYGTSPIETVLMNANTDLRFQAYFMSRFTDGNVPEAFAGAPEGWDPNQIDDFQAAFDALVYGDDKVKHQIKWVPHGTTFAWSNEKDFSDAFSLFLMRKTCAAYHVVPSDLGFTEDVNRATSETQADVQFRIGDLPLIQHVQDLLSDFLQDDCGLPLEFVFDTGADVQDSYTEAQSWDLATKGGAVSIDEWREKVYGLPIDNERPMPRFVMDPKAGPIPLASILQIAGPVDPESGAPADEMPLGATPYAGAPGVLASKSPGGAQFSRAVQNPDEPMFPQLEGPVPGTDIVGTKPGEPVIGQPGAVAKAETTGVTSATGATSYDLVGGGKDADATDVEDDDPIEALKAEVAKEVRTFERFMKSRRREGKWRDFDFLITPPLAAHRLNDVGRSVVLKAIGQPVAAGICVHAMDTGRVLMLQRALDPTDPVGGMWEFPGGHIEDAEAPFDAAVREWQEETGCLLPASVVAGGHSQMQTWAASNGLYVGFIIDVPAEAMIPVGSRGQCTNPDDPDGDVIEAIAWWVPSSLEGNPGIRPELAADIPLVLGALGQGDVIDTTGMVVKASSDGDPRWHDQPIRKIETVLVPKHADAIRDALSSSVSRDQLKAVAAAYIASRTNA